MSILLSVFMAGLAIGGMIAGSEWQYWASCWALCGLFMLVTAIRERKDG